MLKRVNIKKIINFKNISYIYILLLTFDDNPFGFYFALPWVIYLLYYTHKIEFSTKKILLNYGLILLFIFSLFYNKSESSIYYPMVGDEIILKKNIYIYKDFYPLKFYVTDNNSSFNLKDKNWMLISKGEKIKIISFVRRGILNFEPEYDIEIDTTLKPQILKKFNQSEDTKLYFWSNSFLYEIDMLKNTIIKDYIITSNRLFKILYLLYPFALLYLLIRSFKNSINKIEIKYHFNLVSFIIYTIAYYYVLMASINDGLTSFWLGTPYALFLFLEIHSSKKEDKTKYLHILILILASFLSFSDRSKSEILYPMVGESYTISSDINYSCCDFYINEIEIYENRHYHYSDETKQMFTLKAGDIFHIKSQIVTGHGDFGIDYNYEIESKNFSELSKYIEKNLEQIKLEFIKDYERNFHEEKTKFYFGEEKKFYIDDYELRNLMDIQGLHYDESNFETRLTYMSFYLLIYPFILVLFFFIVLAREREFSN